MDQPLYGSACGEIRGGWMNIEYLLIGFVALAIGVYLVVALLRPDKF